jgi:hypothetical protein
MPTSNANEPVRTSANSPDTLPLRGYTIDQLKEYIFRQLGQPVWNVEVTAQQVLDCIQDAVSLFSEWVPLRKPQAIAVQRGQYRYMEGVDVGYGVASVSFVESVPAPTEVFYGNLISPAPIMRTGLDEYDTFMRWRKTWMRVTSVQPDWFYDDADGVLYIHNPLERYHCGVMCYFPYPNCQSLPPVGARWVKEYALAKARYLQGDIWMKFSGAIPGPVKDIQLDNSKRESAAKEMETLKNQLFGMQTQAGIFID